MNGLLPADQSSGLNYTLPLLSVFYPSGEQYTAWGIATIPPQSCGTFYIQATVLFFHNATICN